MQLSDNMTVNKPDLTSTSIELVGLLSGKECRVLLVSGASSDLVSETPVRDKPLPTTAWSFQVIVNVANK